MRAGDDKGRSRRSSTGPAVVNAAEPSPAPSVDAEVPAKVRASHDPSERGRAAGKGGRRHPEDRSRVHTGRLNDNHRALCGAKQNLCATSGGSRRQL